MRFRAGGPRAGGYANLRGLNIEIGGLSIALTAIAVAYVAFTELHGHARLYGLGAALALWSVAQARVHVGRRWQAGAAGERKVAQALRPLERQGWLIAHDLPKSTGGNLDHLAAGPSGVFTIETKLKRFDKRELAQARAHAQWARSWVHSPVVPVLVIAEGSRRPKQFAGVWVMDASRLRRFLSYQPATAVDRAGVSKLLSHSRSQPERRHR